MSNKSNMPHQGTKPPVKSAAAAKRLRAELQQQRAAEPEPLPAAFVQHLTSTYQPATELRQFWPLLLPIVLASLLRSKIRGENSLRKQVTHLVHFWVWALGQSLALDVETTLTRKNTDEYARTGMPGSSEKSRSDRRARLRSLADQIHPELAPDKNVTFTRAAIKAPYTADEMRTVRRVCRVQPTAELSRQLSLCIALGAGAGIDSADMKLLLRGHITEQSDGTLLVTVPGDRSRTVAVLREYEDLLRRGIAGLGARSALLPGDVGRANVCSRVFERAQLLGSVPHLEQSRLRSTWLATLMSRPVPLALILDAAALKTARTLVELVPYIDLEAVRKAHESSADAANDDTLGGEL